MLVDLNHRSGFVYGRAADALPPLGARINTLLDDALGLWLAGDPSGAIQKLVEFEAEVRAAAEAGALPNIWRSARDLDNFAGMLRSRSGTLRFSLGLAG